MATATAKTKLNLNCFIKFVVVIVKLVVKIKKKSIDLTFFLINYSFVLNFYKINDNFNVCL
ncbi:MAG: hypothetical protein CVT98_06995 [Bacteroidetes bacterium HGW-Bacteroidetes-15]|nr:MAG: hypothetical protein CVT98_06995 [Bacteroidetes bacterium HGW-Bacteroidetes-15]